MLIMKILGFTTVYPLLLMTLGTTMVLSTESQTFVLENNISEENILHRKENRKEEKEELPQNLTGKSTTEVLMILNEILEILEKNLLEEKS